MADILAELVEYLEHRKQDKEESIEDWSKNSDPETGEINKWYASSINTAEEEVEIMNKLIDILGEIKL